VPAQLLHNSAAVRDADGPAASERMDALEGEPFCPRRQGPPLTAETELHCYGMTSWDYRSLVERNGDIAWELLASTAKRLYENTRSARVESA
jgi:hypothetical protein